MAKEINGYTLEEALEYVDNCETEDSIDAKQIADLGWTKTEYYSKWKEALNIIYK